MKKLFLVTLIADIDDMYDEAVCRALKDSAKKRLELHGFTIDSVACVATNYLEPDPTNTSLEPPQNV